MSSRNKELGLLVAAALPVLILFATIGVQASGDFQWTYLTVPASLFGLFAAAHLAIRAAAPNADPALLPVVFVLTSIGIGMVTRLSPDTAYSQVLWLVISVAAMSLTLFLVPSLERLGQYKYLLMVAGLVLLLAPALVGTEINGSKLWIRLGSFSIQPGELARVFIILFLAAYLAEKREMLSISTKRIWGIPVPDARALGPLVLMWAVSFLILIGAKDLGSSLLFFGIFLVMLYAATGRLSYTIAGLGLFGVGALVAYQLFTHVQVRVAIWLEPFADPSGAGYQLVQSLFAFADGGLFGTGVGAGLPTRIPYVDTDFIFAAIGEEMGYLGAVAVILCYLVLLFRGLGTASRARSDMAAITATGLTASIALQTFVIVGGVTALIPLTGITLPFVSRGGSSMLSTFIILALLLRAGDDSTGLDSQMVSAAQETSAIRSRQKREYAVLGRVAFSKRLVSIGALFSLLLAALIVNLTWIQVVDASTLQNHVANTRGLEKERRSARGMILSRDGVVLAESIQQSDGTYLRSYPQESLAAHALGYYSLTYGRSGVEAAANDALRGSMSFSSWADVIDDAAGKPVTGNNVVLTIDASVQAAAERALRGIRGAVVALDPSTGAVLAMASNPTYDPNSVESQWDTLSADDEAPLLDRSRQSLTAPGSTFKVVTLTGAYANDVAAPSTTYPGPGMLDIGNAPVTNYGGSSYGETDLVTATARSINTVFGQLADDMGPEILVAQSKQFGFNREVPFELPVRTSLMPDPAEMTVWETAWAGVGQPVGQHASPAGPQSTVFQMALVAAGIANRGSIMQPYIIDRIESASGASSVLGNTQARPWLTVCDAVTADLVGEAMKAVVTRGSGTRAAISGVTVAGKTGTAEVGKGLPTNAWFIAYAPADDPVVAVAVMLEGAGTGGAVAAPAAKPVLEAALKAQGVR